MAAMNSGHSTTEIALDRVRTTVKTVRKSINLLIAMGGVVLFVFAGTVLAATGEDVWAGLIGLSGVMVFCLGVSGFLVYKLLSAYF